MDREIERGKDVIINKKIRIENEDAYTQICKRKRFVYGRVKRDYKSFTQILNHINISEQKAYLE